MSQEIAFGMKYKDPRNATWEDDRLDRAKYAKQLTQLVKHTDKPFVMTLSAPWGSGKTFFLNAWRNEIAWKGKAGADEIPCVYFSAWEYDCVDDPLLAIVGKMQEELNMVLTKEENESSAPAKKEIEKELIKRSNKTLIKLGKIARSVATKETLSKWGLKSINKLFNKTIGESLDDVLEQGDFDEYFTKEDLKELLKDVKNTIGTPPEKKLKAVLKEKNEFIATVKEVIAECREKLGYNHPILIMIDELDRCRPDYVISLLERIKNLFEVDGIFFVLAIDKEQLYSVVEHTFGVKKTEERDNRAVYLQKFVNMDFNLPEVSLNKYFVEIIRQLPEDEQFGDNFGCFGGKYVFELQGVKRDCLYVIKMYFPKSIRDFERKFEKFMVLYKAYNLSRFEYLLLFCIIMEDYAVIRDENVISTCDYDEKKISIG